MPWAWTRHRPCPRARGLPPLPPLHPPRRRRRHPASHKLFSDFQGPSAATSRSHTGLCGDWAPLIRTLKTPRPAGSGHRVCCGTWAGWSLRSQHNGAAGGIYRRQGDGPTTPCPFCSCAQPADPSVSACSRVTSGSFDERRRRAGTLPDPDRPSSTPDAPAAARCPAARL